MARAPKILLIPLFALLGIVSMTLAYEEVRYPIGPESQPEDLIRPKRQFLLGVATGAAVEHHHHNHHGGNGYNNYPYYSSPGYYPGYPGYGYGYSNYYG